MRRLALNKDGLLTYCTCPPEFVGKGRCNHVAHIEEGQDVAAFVRSIDEKAATGEISVQREKALVKFGKDASVKLSYVGDIDLAGKEALFEGRPGNYSLTEYGKYIVLSQGKKAFARLVFELDEDQKYHRQIEVQVKDPYEFAESLKQYQENKNRFDALVKEWKAENSDKFTEEPFIPSVQRYAKYFEFDTEGYTAEDAVQGYKFFSKALDSVDKSKLYIAKRSIIKPEFKEEYVEACISFRKAVGLPTEAELKERVAAVVTQKKHRLALDRKPFKDTAPAKGYARQYVNYLASRDFSSRDREEEYDYS